MKTLLIITLLTMTSSFAQAQTEINCILEPMKFVGNVRLNIDLANSTFKITYEKGNTNDQTIAASGKIYVHRKDSMGFDVIHLSTDTPQEKFLGGIKVVNQSPSDRISYLSLYAAVKVQVSAKETTLPHLNEFGCKYN